MRKQAMAIPKCLAYCLLVAIVFLVTNDSLAEATTIVVDEFGDGGWSSGDTRASGYTDINGGNQLVLGRARTDNPSLLEDTLISPRLSFATAPVTPPMGPGGVRFTTDGNADKATLDRRDWDTPFDALLTLEYTWYRETGGDGVAAPALKLILDTSEANPTGPQSEARYETVGDKILVYEPYLQGGAIQDEIWTTESMDTTEGEFWLVNLTGVSVLPATDPSDLRTLQQWQTEFNNAGQSGVITSLQLSIGSGSPGLDSYVDFLSFSSSAGQTTWNFEATPVPEPTALSLAIALLMGIAIRQRRRV